MTSKDWVDPIEASARELLKKGLGRMPELRDLSADEALQVVVQAERLAADEQDNALYATGGLQIALAIGAFHLFIKIYRGRTARRMRPYVLKVLEDRKQAA